MSRVVLRVKVGIVCHMTTETDTSPATPWVHSDDTFAARLALVRHRMGWNVKEAARAAGVPGASWRLWEIDGANPRDKVATGKKIAAASGCDYLWLVHGPDRGGAVSMRGFSAREGRVVTTVSDPPRTLRPVGPVRRTRPIAGAAPRPVTPVAI